MSQGQKREKEAMGSLTPSRGDQPLQKNDLIKLN